MRETACERKICEKRTRTNTRVGNEQKKCWHGLRSDSEIRFGIKMRKLDFKLNYFRVIFTFSDTMYTEKFWNESMQSDGGERGGCDADNIEDVLFVHNFPTAHANHIK